MNQKGFSLVIFLSIISLLSVGIVGGAFVIKNRSGNHMSVPIPITSLVETQNKVATQGSFLTQASLVTDTTDWQTYTNNKWHYQLKYPADWWIDNRSSSTDQSDQIEIYNYNYDQAHKEAETPKPISNNELFKVAIRVYKNQNIDNFLKIRKKAMEPFTKKPYVITQESQIEVDSYKGLYYEVEAPRINSLVSETLIQMPHELLTFTIWKSDNLDTNKKIYKDILSTLKFIK